MSYAKLETIEWREEKMKRSCQLSNQELMWCREVAKKLRKAYDKYAYARQILTGVKPLTIPTGTKPTHNLTEWSHVTKITWEQFLEKLRERERELVDEIVHYGTDYFTKEEKRALVGISALAKKMGLF